MSSGNRCVLGAPRPGANPATGYIYVMRFVGCAIIIAACGGSVACSPPYKCPPSPPDQYYPNQCLDRTELWTTIYSHNSKGRPRDGGVPADCPTSIEFALADVMPDLTLGLKGRQFTDPPAYDPAADTCCYTTADLHGGCK